jgi:hypothetical protein
MSPGKRGRPPKPKPQPAPKTPCVECGSPSATNVDPFGIPSSQWHCRECYERLCARTYAEATRIRYG